MADETDKANDHAAERKLRGGIFEFALEHTAETEAAEGYDVVGEGDYQISAYARDPCEVFKPGQELEYREHKGSGNAVLDASAVGVDDYRHLCKDAEAAAVGIRPGDKIGYGKESDGEGDHYRTLGKDYRFFV